MPIDIEELSDRFLSADTSFVGWGASLDPISMRAMAEAGFEAVCIDLQHGLMMPENLYESISAIASGGAVPMVRIPYIEAGIISKSLDLGALGLICPMVSTASDAERLVRMSKYPPIGDRSWGPAGALTIYGLDRQEYFEKSKSLVKIHAMIETAESIDNLDEIAATPGLDGLFVGPNDLCISMTNGAEINAKHALVENALPKVIQAAKKNNLISSIYSFNGADAKRYSEMGFDMVAISNNIMLVKQAASLELDAARRTD